jgi:hypothetical protein
MGAMGFAYSDVHRIPGDISAVLLTWRSMPCSGSVKQALVVSTKPTVLPAREHILRRLRLGRGGSGAPGRSLRGACVPAGVLAPSAAAGCHACHRCPGGVQSIYGAATLWFGAELRARWRATLGLALLVGVVAGACLAAGAGARRTESAYPRFVARYGAFDAEVSTGGDPETDQIFDEIAHLPEVVATSRSSLFVGSVTARGHTVSFPDVMLVAAHEAGGFDAVGVKVVRGRLADPEAVDEAVAGYAFAERLGLRPGDTITVSVAPQEGDGDEPGTSGPVTEKLRLVGVVAWVGGFETLTGRGFPNVVGLTPAFFRAHRPAALTDEDTMEVALRHGRRISRRSPTRYAGAGSRSPLRPCPPPCTRPTSRP